MTATQKLFFLALAFCFSLGAAIGIFLYISLVPYFFIIGKFAAGLLAFALVCVAVLIGAFTWAQVGILFANRRRARLHQYVVAVGDVVVHIAPDGKFTHLSAMHEQAKIPPPGVTVNALPASTTEDETIIELYSHGQTLRSICEATGAKYNRVQKVTSDYEKRHSVKQ